MKVTELTNEQRRQLIDVKQAFQIWRDAHRQIANSYKGTVRWKKSKGQDYLYRTVYRGEAEIAKSLGPRSPRTEKLKEALSYLDLSFESRHLSALPKELRQLAPELKKKAKAWLKDNPITPDNA